MTDPAARWAAVVVNFESGPLLSECVQSVLADASAGPAELVVVDNRSRDDSVALMQAASQAMRLLHQADDYQQAAMLADRVARDTTLVAEGVDTGQEGRFRWERRVRPVPVPETVGLSTEPAPRLHAVSVAVRWGRGRALEAAPRARQSSPRCRASKVHENRSR